VRNPEPVTRGGEASRGKPYEELVGSVQKNNWRIHERFLGKRGGKE